jgi:hypothetical protein
MKIFFRLLACWILTFSGGARVWAQVLAQDNAAAYNAAGNVWTNGMNLGFGFGPWTLVTANVGGYAGHFIGNGGAIATANNSAWGLYGNGPVTNTASSGNAAVAYRAFSNALPANGVFKIKWRNLGIGGDLNPPYHQGGFALRNGNANATVDDYFTNVRLAFYYFGGVDDNFRIFDANGAVATGLGFGAGPFELNVLLTGTDTYRLIVKNPAGTTVITNYEGTLAGSGTIDSVALYDFQCDGDQVFNSMEISTTSLLPPVVQNVQPADGAAYLPTSTAITFDVVSEFTGVSTNNILLMLNGTNVGGLSFSGSATNWSVTKTGALADNATYNAAIVVTDLNGNKTTNRFSFNTWRADNFFIEAEDYNFSGGGFIPVYFPNGYTNLLGVNGVDYLDSPGNGTSIYRTNDLPATEVAPDIDHNDFLANGYVDFNLAYIQSGEWENYTRRLSNAAYTVYARMSGGGDNPVMLMERLAQATATTSNQPLAALGTFVGTNTFNIVSNYTFVPLKDFFSSNVIVRFSRAAAPSTNTFRLTRIGDGYNLNYLIFVPVSVTSTQRPYLSAGFPFPGAANVEPDQPISFTIANRETAVAPASIQLFVNNANVTGSLTTSNNAAGCAVTYSPTGYHLLGTNNTVTVIYADSEGVSQTNSWLFSVADVPVIPPAYALPPGAAANRGFNVRIAKATNSASLALFPLSAARVDNHLAGLINDPDTGLPFFNEAGGPNGDGRYAETNVINYNQAVGFGDSGLPGDVNFPYVAQTVEGYYTNDPNNISMEAIAYAQLSPGIYKWAVRSDDGFRLTFGAGANPTNLIVGNFDGGRDDTVPSEFEFIVQTAGLYPFRLVYYEGNGFANCELYAINRSNGQAILINDPANGAAIPTFRDVPVILRNPAHSGNTTTFNFLTQAGRTHVVEYKDALTNGPWQPLQTVVGNGAVTNITDATAVGSTRFYRVNTQ